MTFGYSGFGHDITSHTRGGSEPFVLLDESDDCGTEWCVINVFGIAIPKIMMPKSTNLGQLSPPPPKFQKIFTKEVITRKLLIFII